MPLKQTQKKVNSAQKLMSEGNTTKPILH
ncbi:hypothetical protein OIU89_08570 [Escherichia coli]|nr:hypothetical protein [Escherichia coli]